MSNAPTTRSNGQDQLALLPQPARSGHVAAMLNRRSLVSSDLVPRWAMFATLAFVVASVAVSVVAALTRGPWMDEFWSLWLTNTDVPWSVALHERWLADVHPPLFSATSRLVSGVFGDELPLRRLQNLVPLAALIVFFAYVDQAWSRSRRFVAVYAVLCFGSYFATGYFAEYRSYFAQFCLGIVFYASGYALLCRDHVVAARQRRIVTGLLAVSSLLLFNLHFVTALIAAISLAVMGLVLLGQREYRLFLSLVVIAVLSTAPLVATLVFQAPYLLAKSGGRFWIDTSWTEALQVIAGSVAKGIGLNIVVCLAAGWGLLTVRGRRAATFGTTHAPERNDIRGRRFEEIVVGIAFVGASLLALAVLFVLNFQTPIIIDRYLVLCSVAIACGIAILAKDVVFAVPGGFALLLVNSSLFLVISADKLIAEPRWNASAALIAGLPTRCPDAPVEAFDFPYANTLENEPAVLEFAYRRLAGQFGFPLHITQPGSADRPRVAVACPRILWTENVPWLTLPHDNPDAAVLAAAKAATGLKDMTGADVRRTKTGAVVILNNNPRS